MRILISVVSGLLTVLSAPLYAQVVAELNPVVISARGYSQLASETLSSVTVVGRDEIDQSQAKSLVDLLKGQPGFEFGRNGGIGTTTSIFLRGADSKNTVVLIDGVRAHSDNIGAINLSDISLSHVERVEILRGNASALYGESAIGGVISITTRVPNSGTPKAYGSIGVGARNTHELTAGYGGSLDDVQFNVIASRFYTDGFSAKFRANANQDEDRYESQAFSGVVSKRLSGKNEVGLRFNLIDAETDYDMFSLVDEDTFKSKTNSFSAYIKSEVTERLFSTFDIGRSDLRYQDLKNGQLRTADDFVDGLQKGESTSYSLSNLYELNETTNLRFGFGYTDSKYTLTGYTNATNYRDSLGYFLGLDTKVDRLAIQASLRRDELDAGRVQGISHNYDETTYLIGLGYSLMGPYRLTATHSLGFRAPAPAEFLGTPSLRPERSETSEVGLEYRKDQAVFRLVYFDTSSRDAIYYDPNLFEFGNQHVDNYGLEALGQMVFKGYSLKLAYTQQKPINTTLNIEQARRAQNFGSFEMKRDFDATSMGVTIIWSGSRRDSDFTEQRLPSYAVGNFFLSRQLDSNWRFRLLIENFTDEKYEIASGYNTPRRGVFLTLQYQ